MNLLQYLNKKTTCVQYNLLNLPCRIEFEDGNCISYVYDANGTKLRSAHVIDGIAKTLTCASGLCVSCRKGLGEISGGVLASPETAGASLAISAQGALDITHGSLMATSGALKLFSRKGRVDESSSDSGGYSKSSGKNEKHSNLKARKAAEEKMNAAKEKLEIMRKENKYSNDELNEVKKEIKHWKRKMDDAGETHHR